MHNFSSNQVRSHQSSTAMFTLSDCKIWNHFKQIINWNHFEFTVFTYAIDKENRAAARQFGVEQKNVLKVAITTRNIERSLSWSESSTLMPSKMFWIGERTEEIDWPEEEGQMAKVRNIAYRVSFELWYIGVIIITWIDMTCRFARGEQFHKSQTTLRRNFRNFKPLLLLNRSKYCTNMSSHWLEM